MDDKSAKQNAANAEAPGRVSRRTFLKTAGIGVVGAAAITTGLVKLGQQEESDLPEPSEVTLRENPKNGDMISVLGFGFMRLPFLSGSSGPAPANGIIDEAAVFRMVDRAIESGVNYFDTAYVYHGGKSEVVLARALQRYRRDKIFISDKMPRMELDLAGAKEVFQTQLDRLQTDYIDYYMLHNQTTTEAYKAMYEESGILDYLLAEKEAGRIRNLGWSFHGDKECLEYLLSRPVEWDMALLQLNYHDLLHEYQAPPYVIARTSQPSPPKWNYERMMQTDIPLFVMEPLLGGRLGRLSRKAMAVLSQEKPRDSAASWAFRYAAGLPHVVGVLSGMTYMEHLDDNLRTFGPYSPLSEQEMTVLQNAVAIFVSQDVVRCTYCNYCIPCPYGIDIPAVFAHFNRYVDDEQVPKGERNADYEQARRAYLVGYDRSVAELSQAQRCTGCGKCVKLCPQWIDIPAEMSRLGRFAEQLRNEV
ncbi:MAG: aldo/keto reductase [Deltaproteobacteria bacterium]|jgi:predicted aldo/keto reductase-like oxidoreductase|nr:aldo/keto reductase [Deltaproteobacteria bacterium]